MMTKILPEIANSNSRNQKKSLEIQQIPRNQQEAEIKRNQEISYTNRAVADP